MTNFAVINILFCELTTFCDTLDCWRHLLRQQDIAVGLILAVHFHPRVNSKISVQSYRGLPIVDTATDTITDLLNVKRVRSSWDRCVASWYRLVHKPDRSASWIVVRR